MAVDRFGNAIGLVQFTQYLAIEKIEWKHGSAFDDDYALADVLLASGEKVSGVKVSMVNNKALINTKDAAGQLADKNGTDKTTKTGFAVVGTVSDHYTNNKEYYNHIFTYAIDENGAYSLGTDLGFGEHDNAVTNNCAHTDAVTSAAEDLWAATITRGEATIYGVGNNANTYTATDNTVFALLNADGYTYTTYVGKNNVPTVTNADVCVQVGENGYAAFVVVKGSYKVASNTFLGYVTDVNADGGRYFDGTYVDGYNVYRLGEATPTMVYDASNQFTTAFAGGPGFYEIEVDANGMLKAGGIKVAVNAPASELDSSLNGFIANAYQVPGTNDTWMNHYAIRRASGNSFKAMDYTSATITPDYTKRNGYSVTGAGGTYDVDFNATEDTKVVILNKATLTGATNSVSAGSLDDLNYLDDVAIAYVVWTGRTAGTSAPIYTASTIYLVKLPNTATTTRLWNVCGTNHGLVYTINGNIVAQNPTCYVSVDATAAARTAALKAAVDNATEIKMSEINNPTGSYTINMTTAGMWCTVKTFNNAGSITLSSIGTAGPAGTDTVTSGLAVGNYIVSCGNTTGAGDANHFQAYVIVP